MRVGKSVSRDARLGSIERDLGGVQGAGCLLDGIIGVCLCGFCRDKLFVSLINFRFRIFDVGLGILQVALGLGEGVVCGICLSLRLVNGILRFAQRFWGCLSCSFLCFCQRIVCLLGLFGSQLVCLLLFGSVCLGGG